MGAPGKPSPVSRENGMKGGRPVASATLQAQLFRDALASRITRDADKWMTSIEDLANGHFVEVKTKDGSVKVYKKSPDAQAWDKATSRAFGKPEQPIDHTTKGESLNADLKPEHQKLITEYEDKLRKSL